MLKDAIDSFRLNIKSVKELDNIVTSVNSVMPLIDMSEVIRAELVLAVSALDSFLHDIIRLATLEIYQGTRSYNHRLTVKPEFDDLKKNYLLTRSKNDQILEIDAELRRIFKTRTFQDPEIISKNLLVIGLEDVWSKIGLTLGMTKANIERRLSLIIGRRNVIAHEADIDYTKGVGIKNPIDKTDTLNDVLFIESIVENLYLLL